jgi:hypothetical protein
MYRHRTDSTTTALVVAEWHANRWSSFLTLHGIRQGNVYIAFVDIEAVRFPQILRSHVSQEHVL